MTRNPDRISVGGQYRLVSHDYSSLEHEKFCTVVRIVTIGDSFPLAVLELETLVTSGGRSSKTVVIGTRHFPDTVLSISTWPLSVNVSFMKEGGTITEAISESDLEFFAIGEIVPI